jgi:hypothetical protein
MLYGLDADSVVKRPPPRLRSVVYQLTADLFQIFFSSSGFLTQFLYEISISPCMLRIPPVPLYLFHHLSNFVNSTHFKIPHSVILFTVLFLFLS